MSGPADARRGALLIIVAGLSALLASVALAFLINARSESEASALSQRETQAHLMLTAACQYVLEAGRIGWDAETYGWNDVRDGAVGPRRADGTPVWNAAKIEPTGDAQGQRPLWPAIGGLARCPMHRLVRPRYAVSADMTPNPIDTDPASEVFGLPFPTRAWPRPAASDWGSFRDGDPRVVMDTVGRAWFRVLRLDSERFLLTCGAGGTQGFRDWPEVMAQGAWQAFGPDAASGEEQYRALDEAEVRRWYLVEWSTAVGGALQGLTGGIDRQDLGGGATARNHGGTIRWIQRLRHEPAYF